MPNSGEFSRNPEILDATGFSGDGSLLTFGELHFTGRTDTPVDPLPGDAIMWLDKTNARLCVKITDTDGNTVTDCISPMTGTDGDGNKVPVKVLSDGKLDIEQTALYAVQIQTLRELHKLNMYLAKMNDIIINDEDVEV